MARSRKLAAAALFVALAAPATADAAPRGAVAPAKAAVSLSSAAAVGLRYWGAMPCQGQVKVLSGRPVAAGLMPDSDAWVTFDSPLGANNLAAPASSYTNCAISFARWRWPTSASMQEDWGMVCATMVHEIGHLLGHVHDADPGSVMAPVFTDVASVPPVCRKTPPNRPGRRHR